jgi:ABC-type glycerol-3-phosphate transport system permease component
MRKKIFSLVRILKFLGVLAIAFPTLFPLYWMLNVSLLPEPEVIRPNPHLYPPPNIMTLCAYEEVLGDHPLLRYMLNSVLIVGLASLITVFLGFAVAYSLAKHKFRFKNLLYYTIIWFLAIPFVVYVLPIFKIAVGLRLLDTHILMIMLYGFSGIPLFSWFALPHLHDFPDELIDAGRMDGCSEVGIVARIVIPALKNPLLALIILRFVMAYNDLLYSMSFTYDEAKMIMPALLGLPGLFDIPFARMAAGGFIAVAPILLMVIVFQKHVISGLTGRT